MSLLEQLNSAIEQSQNQLSQLNTQAAAVSNASQSLEAAKSNALTTIAQASKTLDGLKQTLRTTLYIDPKYGDDSADGLSEATPIKTAAAIEEKTADSVDHLRLHFCVKEGSSSYHNRTFELDRTISANKTLTVTSEFRNFARLGITQTKANMAQLKAPNIHVADVQELYTFKSEANQSSIPWAKRGMISGQKISFDNVQCYLNCNPIIDTADHHMNELDQSVNFFAHSCYLGINKYDHPDPRWRTPYLFSGVNNQKVARPTYVLGWVNVSDQRPTKINTRKFINVGSQFLFHRMGEHID